MRLYGVTGTVPGRAHARLHRNNQDGAAIAVSSEVVVAVVADGCSSAPGSDVGAKLAATFVAARLPVWIARHPDAAPEEIAAVVVDGLVELLRATALRLSPPTSAVWSEGSSSRMSAPVASAIAPEIVADLFLFTLLVAVVDRRRALVFGVGDGAYVVDDRVVVLDAGPRNAPAYLAYALVDPKALDRPPSFAPVVHFAGCADEISTLAIATDGAVELEARRHELLRDGARAPGLAELVGDPRLAANPSLLTKRLVALGAVNGRLADDTTIAVIGRAPEEARAYHPVLASSAIGGLS